MSKYVMYMTNFFQTLHSAPLQNSSPSYWVSRGNGRLHFRKTPTHQGTQKLQGKFMLFDTKLSNASKYNYLEPGLYHSYTDIVEALNTLIEERHNHTKLLSQTRCLEEGKMLKFTSQLKDRVLHSLVRNGVTIMVAMLAMTLQFRWDKIDLTR